MCFSRVLFYSNVPQSLLYPLLLQKKLRIVVCHCLLVFFDHKYIFDANPSHHRPNTREKTHKQTSLYKQYHFAQTIASRKKRGPSSQVAAHRSPYFTQSSQNTYRKFLNFSRLPNFFLRDDQAIPKASVYSTACIPPRVFHRHIPQSCA